MKLWIENTHEEYEGRAKRFTYIEDHYTGAAEEKAERKARELQDRIVRDADGNIHSVRMDEGALYLYRRAQGETKPAYIERVMLSTFPNVHAAVVDSFTGSIQAVEHKAARDLSIFGDIDEPQSFAAQIWRNADGMGTNYMSMFSQAASMLTNHGRVWYLVEDDSFVWLDERDVLNWMETTIYTLDGTKSRVLTDVVVREKIDGREDIKSDYPDEEERLRFVHYHKDGFDRYRIAENDRGEREAVLIEEESGLWEYPHYDDKGVESLPVGYIDIPVTRHPGYKMAKDANKLYNLLSDVRNLLRTANHPKLAGDVTDDEFEYTEMAVARGSNMLQGAWQYIGPPIENAQGGYEIYEKQVMAFYVTNHQRYQDAARERTATEIKQDDQRGTQSWLNVLTTSLDELEGVVLRLLAQKQFPTSPDAWNDAVAERSRDFKPVDAEARAKKLQDRYIDGKVDVGETGRFEVSKEIAALDGITYDEEELEQVVSDEETARRQEEAQASELNELNSLINQAA